MEEKIKIIQNLVKTKINYDGNIFDSIAIDINNLVDNKVAHNIQEIKNKNNCKREKGDLWEAFCFLYLKYILNHDEVWLYKDIPIDLKEKFNLTKNDFGIDIISKKNNNYYAIQCKFKKPMTKVQIISWRSLSTFYAIVTKTGPWEKHIIMTNVNGCKHIGKKQVKDQSICIGTFRNTNHFDWLKIIGEDVINKKGETIIDKKEEIIIDETKEIIINKTKENIRDLRVKYYNNLQNNDKVV